MPALNKVFLMGHLTRAPELQHLQSGLAMCKFGLAVSRRYFDKNTSEKKEEVCFTDIVVWGKSAESCGQYLDKGQAVMVDGHLKFQTWEKDGQRRSKLEVIAENVQFLEKKQTSGGGNAEASQGSIPF